MARRETFVHPRRRSALRIGGFVARWSALALMVLGFAVWCFAAWTWPGQVNGLDVLGAVIFVAALLRVLRPVRRSDRG